MYELGVLSTQHQVEISKWNGIAKIAHKFPRFSQKLAKFLFRVKNSQILVILGSKIAGYFFKILIAKSGLKIAHLAINSQSWQHCKTWKIEIFTFGIVCFDSTKLRILALVILKQSFFGEDRALAIQFS